MEPVLVRDLRFSWTLTDMMTDLLPAEKEAENYSLALTDARH